MIFPLVFKSNFINENFFEFVDQFCFYLKKNLFTIVSPFPSQ